MNSKVFPKISLDSQMLYDRLAEAKPGETISYAELTDLIGRDVQTEAYGCLATARRKARNHNRKVFGTLAKVGLKCLEDAEIVDSGYRSLTTVKRRARDGLKKLICLQDYNGLADHMKVKHNAVAAILMVANRMTTPKKVAALETVVSEKMQKLTFTQTLEFFGKK